MEDIISSCHIQKRRILLEPKVRCGHNESAFVARQRKVNANRHPLAAALSMTNERALDHSKMPSSDPELQ